MRMSRAVPVVGLICLTTVLLVGGLGGSALAQTYPPTTPPTQPVVSPAEESPTTEVSPAVVEAGEAGGAGGEAGGAAGEGGALAFTGAEIWLLVLAAALLAGIGALALIAARRRRASA
jgi:hypothetical protein